MLTLSFPEDYLSEIMVTGGTLTAVSTSSSSFRWSDSPELIIPIFLFKSIKFDWHISRRHIREQGRVSSCYVA